jgi:DNA phosphorothioation-dependent restriction protein DptG
MEKEAIESKASEISSWIGDAVSDIAYGAVEFQDAETQEKFRKAKKNGVTDLQGWYADELYNDVDTLQDLTGDRIYDAAEGKDKEKWENMIRIAEVMQDSGYKALTIALTRHIKSWRKTVMRLTY